MDIFSSDQITVLCKPPSFVLHSCKTIDRHFVTVYFIVYMNRVNIKNQNSFFFVISSRATLNETLTAKNNNILPRTP